MVFQRTHGKRKTRVYQVWVDMIRRCTKPSRVGYENYGGRGISVCPEWMDFCEFYADMGDPPDGASLDRVDNDGNYEASNCRWATDAEQSNNKRTNRFVIVRGERMTISAAARRYGISKRTLRERIENGWPDEKAVTSPVRKTIPSSEWRRRA